MLTFRRLPGSFSAPDLNGPGTDTTQQSLSLFDCLILTCDMKTVTTSNVADQRIEIAKDTTRHDDRQCRLAHGLSQGDFNEVEKRLRRKLDSRLMTTIVLMYMLNFLDRVSLATL
nr:hypothetical protein CFP56_33663 [Quercus suber]